MKDVYKRQEYDNAIKKRKKAITLLENYHELEHSERSVNLLSNLYNNLSNTYLLQNKKNEAIEALKTAFEVRKSLAARGFYETHDQLQQIMNLVNMLILSKEYSAAENLTALYEKLVSEYLGKDCLDYGVCQLTKGILAYKPVSYTHLS